MGSRQRDQLTLFLICLVVRLAAALLISGPGYMDTAYYAAGAIRIAQGEGFTEPFIWNYLNDPAELPHPGFLYWMPLPSVLGAPLAALFPGSFFALQMPFAILSAGIPAVAYALAWEVAGRRQLAWATGLIALFSGFFFPYWTLPETFAPFALFGSLALWLAGRRGWGWARRGRALTQWLTVGLLVGLAHLTRADGVLLLAVVALSALSRRSPGPAGESVGDASLAATTAGGRGAHWMRALSLLAIVVGYAVAMGPWFIRNSLVVGTPLPATGAKTVWLTEYNDLFCYECDLNLSSYLSWGWANIVQSKVTALWTNLQRLLAEDCLVFLAPFTVIGFWRLRRRRSFALGLAYLLASYLTHSLIFTFPGWRGGFFHASSAALPFVYASAAAGLDDTVRWMAKRRTSWRYGQASTVFVIGAVVGALLLSGYAGVQKVPAWREAGAVYERVDEWLSSQGAADAGAVVANPPAFWYHTGRQATVVPNGDVESLLAVADRYGMRYVLLEADHPAQLADVHSGTVNHPRLSYVRTWSEGDDVLYAVQR